MMKNYSGSGSISLQAAGNEIPDSQIVYNYKGRHTSYDPFDQKKITKKILNQRNQYGEKN
jgi:hypothetical protein